MWLVRPVYVVMELVVVAATTGRYHLVDDTVSDLGASECRRDFCSPEHALMNGTFVGVGLLLALGALLLAARLGPAATVLLVLAGLSSVATGFLPVDEDETLHVLAAAPLFVCQPVALLLLGRAVRPVHARLGATLLVAGSLTAAAAVGFVLGGAADGALERLALWPVLFALAAFGVVSRRWPARSRSGTGGPPPRA